MVGAPKVPVELVGQMGRRGFQRELLVEGDLRPGLGFGHGEAPA